jgi:hypothetical protein
MAARAPGRMTPMTGTEKCSSNVGKAKEEAVLQATTTAFAFSATRTSTISKL